MSPDQSLFTPADRTMLEHTILVRHRLEEQYAQPRTADTRPPRWACGFSWPPK